MTASNLRKITVSNAWMRAPRTPVIRGGLLPLTYCPHTLCPCTKQSPAHTSHSATPHCPHTLPRHQTVTSTHQSLNHSTQSTYTAKAPNTQSLTYHLPPTPPSPTHSLISLLHLPHPLISLPHLHWLISLAHLHSVISLLCTQA